MGAIIDKIRILADKCDEYEKELVEEMVHGAANYVRQVIIMESTVINFAGREGTTLRDGIEKTDKRRSEIHNALISAVNIVNRFCGKYNLEPVYTGESHRRCYGDFALELVSEIFNERS